MIPKTIHYCWFGGNQLPDSAVRCIDSWKKYCPDYEIREWNENNFDTNLNTFTRKAYEAKKWAFVSDVARLWIIYNNGGIYMDIDVEVIKPLDGLLNSNMYIGFESDNFMNTGLGFGAERNFYVIKRMLDMYEELSFVDFENAIDVISCPVHNTEAMKNEGFILNNTKQTINNITVYPTEYFCPKNNLSGKLVITENTHTIHHFDASWWTEKERLELRTQQKWAKILGIKIGGLVSSAAIVYKTDGLRGLLHEIRKKFRL